MATCRQEQRWQHRLQRAEGRTFIQYTILTMLIQPDVWVFQRAMRNMEDVRAFLHVPRNTKADDLDSVCTLKLTALFNQLGKQQKDSITEDEWMKLFDDPEASCQAYCMSFCVSPQRRLRVD